MDYGTINPWQCGQSKLLTDKYECFVEASETRGTTALVYWLINSSLYTGTVQG